MKKQSQETSKPFALAELAEKALQEAVLEAAKDHERTGDSMAVWKNGKVVQIPASRFKISELQANYRSKKKKV